MEYFLKVEKSFGILWNPMESFDHTVSENESHTLSKLALLKWGHFDRAKPIFKIPLVSWTETESTDEV